MNVVMNDVLALILGGGRGTRCSRSRTCGRSRRCRSAASTGSSTSRSATACTPDIKRIFVLTQFNSASLNRHIAQTYRMDLFSRRLRRDPGRRTDARTTPNWFQGTADAVRQAARHFAALRRRLLPDPRRRSSLPDGLLRADRGAHREPRRHHHRGAAGHARRRDRDGHLPVRHARPDRRLRGEARRASGSPRSAAASRAASTFAALTADKPFVASMGIYVFSRDVLLEMLAAGPARRTSAARSSRTRSAATACNALPLPRLLGRRRHDRVVLRREHHADAAAARRSTSTIRAGRSTRTRAFCPARGCATAPIDDVDHRRGLLPRSTARSSSRSSASAPTSAPARAIRRSVLLGADFYEPTRGAGARRRPRSASAATSCSIGVIVDKNARIGDGARLVNERRRRARRRRRLLHPQRHHHRAQGRGREVRRLGLAHAATPSTRPAAHHSSRHSSC